MNMTKAPAILVDNLHFRWPKASHDCLVIPHWEVARGERVFLYGRSGSGKTTLLNIIAGINSTAHGEIALFGQPLNILTQKQRDSFRADNIGVIFQQFNLIPYLSIADNIQLSHHFANAAPDNNNITALLADLQLDHLNPKQQAGKLSVGQQQRVAVARALYHQPPLIIADEPTSALDEETRDQFIQLLLRQAEKTQCTVLFVSHDKTLSKHFDRHIDLAQLNTAEKAGELN